MAAKTMTKSAFEDRTIRLPLEVILPTRALGKQIRETIKFKTILASVREVGVIEPLAVYPEGKGARQERTYLLLDGHLRFEALRAVGTSEAVCIVATDDESFTYNRQVNRLSAVQEHRMIMQAVSKGVPPERIARALDVDVARIHERRRLLEGIAPEAVDLLKERMVSRSVFGVLRKMKPMRQIEAAELMISANRFVLPYVKMLLAASRPEMLMEEKTRRIGATPEDIARMERQLEKLYQDYKVDEDALGESMLVLVVAKGFIGRLLRNEALSVYLTRHHGHLMGELTSVMEAVASEVRAPGRD